MSPTALSALRLVIAHTSSRALSFLQHTTPDHHRSLTHSHLHAAARLHTRTPLTQGTQTLTFGFAFFGILLALLLSAHFFQRYSNRRQRAFRARVLALREAREAAEECRPRIWDVYVRSEDVDGSAGGSGDGRGSGVSGREKEVRWEDIQPLSAYTSPPPSSSNPTDLSNPSSDEPPTSPTHLHLPLSLLPLPPPRNLYNRSRTQNPPSSTAAAIATTDSDADTQTWGRERPLSVSVLISMPSPPVPAEKSKHEYDSEPESVFEHACFELGVAKIH